MVPSSYVQVNILDMLEQVGADVCQSILSTYSCPLNTDVENFIRTRAILFAKQRIAVSYLIFVTGDKGSALSGYYTLANKFVCVEKAALSKTMQKKILRFSQYDSLTERYLISMPLLAQLGKNYNTLQTDEIAGRDLLGLACQRVSEIQHLIGGRTAYLECGNQPKLYEFYSSEGFFRFGQRERYAAQDGDGKLVQMLKYFSH